MSTEQQEQQFIIQRIYVKDVSFEAPNSPGMFTQEWNPDTNLDLNTHVNPLSSDNYEVELAITITVKSSDKTAFLVEVTQAGVFFITGYAQEQINHLLAAYCPNILFPYAREVIASLVSKGSFPELHLSPINFDALYARRLQEEQAKEQGAAE
ncbi:MULTISPECIES: protein-export chaperone SecB [Thiothrix]|jgi:preprotein translocase subunit SecB|uniref:Protein-export protein SecB n=2 Tax=Thiothrix TaxID=1030 RepID=A0A975IHC9_9GAMM|nr:MULTISPECIES: protein-export chaperone SecB [Thiothrix]MDX9989848.1 protein-export chaperone SecB [Thiothrix unzii]OQX10340.1 MAG: protein-export chaperone SecB [Thiothrix lacustris]QTR53797.1 protein-export chaperone SecB [Thiothrix unzii]